MHVVLICHPQKFIYLKTHKTGSTSAELALEPFCAPPDHKIYRNRKNMLVSDYGIVGARAPGRDAIVSRTPGLFWHHMGAKRVLNIIGEETFQSYKKVACVRNPFKRLLSQFFFKANWEKSTTTPTNLDDARVQFRTFLMSDPNDKSNVSRVKTDYFLVHIDDRFVLDDVLRVECLEGDLNTFLRNVGIQNPTFALTRERDNANAKRDWSLMDFFDDAELVERAIHLDEWVFRVANYSTDPREA
ncbi:MAG: sulfotransferase family 2 domain-containing protein [Paracoccaceae bacterium]